ncbi:MAG: hypothetical protein JSW33_12960, partial [bacterium]
MHRFTVVAVMLTLILSASFSLAADAERSPFISLEKPQLPGIEAPWDLQDSINLEVVTGALGNAGSEFDGTYYYTTRWGSNLLHKMDLTGALVEEFSIPGVSGLRDLAFDGTYMYGGAAANTIYQMDFVSKTLIGTITSPVAVRHIAYDETNDAFWVGNWNTNIVLVSRTGQTLASIPAATHGFLGMYGSAYDSYTSGGPYLMVFDQGSGAGFPQLVHQVDLNTLTPTGVSYDVTSDFTTNAGIAGGLWIGEGVVPGFASIGGVLQGTPDVLFAYELAAAAAPDDPLPPTNVAAYSDYLTPAAMSLTWTDPTSLVSGTPLAAGDFTIEIERDGTPLTSVAGGTGNYTDTGLTDGTLYEYTLYAKLVANDSTSSSVVVSWYAGGSPTPSSPTSLAVVGGATDAVLTWTDPTTQEDGTPLDDLDSIYVYRDGNLIAAVDAGVQTYTDVPPPNFFYNYYVVAKDDETPSNLSAPSNTAGAFIGTTP